MMREQLKRIEGNRQAFIGTFERFGKKSGWNGKELKTVLFKEIKDLSGKLICDHIWFNYTKGFESQGLAHGDCVMFQARVKKYWKGYKGYRDNYDLPPIEKDYKLSHPTKIQKIVNPLKEVFGEWPGAENIEEILSALEDK